MSVLSLPVVFSQSTSPCLVPCCSFRSARFLRESRGRRCALLPAGSAHPHALRPSPDPQPSAYVGPPAVVLKTLFEAPPLLLWGLPAAQTRPLQREAWESQAQACARVGPAPRGARGRAQMGDCCTSSAPELAGRRLRPVSTPRRELRVGPCPQMTTQTPARGRHPRLGFLYSLAEGGSRAAEVIR